MDAMSDAFATGRSRHGQQYHLLAAPVSVLRFLRDAQRHGERAALAMLVGQVGGGPRSLGTPMAVLGTGDSAGSLSSGCVEAAIVAEALDVIARGEPRDVRFGEGSRYVDIRLPCGAAMDVRFIPDPEPAVIERAVALLEQRRPLGLTVSADGRLSAVEAATTSAGTAEDFTAHYLPELRLVATGHGPETLALLKMAGGYGADLLLLTPDDEIAAAATELGVTTQLLTSQGTVPAIAADRWTAVALLFHDHDWEPALLDAALASDAYWIGAMGSRETARRRRDALVASGRDEAAIGRVRGPIGLIESTRDPAALALSTLAEIVAHFPGAPG